MVTYYFLEGNSCTGSVSRFAQLSAAQGNSVLVSDYFGRVFSKADLLAFVISELKNNSVTECIIIGSSFGGHLSFHIADYLMNFPEYNIQVRGLIVSGTPPIGGPQNFSEAFRPPSEFVEPGGRPVLELLSSPTRMTLDESRRFVLPAFGWLDGFPSEEDYFLFQENVRNVTEELEGKDMGRTRFEILTNLTSFGNEIAIVNNLVQSGLPILFLQAELDPVINGDYIRSVIPSSAQFKILPNCPHYAHWACPQVFWEAVTGFGLKF